MLPASTGACARSGLPGGCPAVGVCAAHFPKSALLSFRPKVCISPAQKNPPSRAGNRRKPALRNPVQFPGAHGQKTLDFRRGRSRSERRWRETRRSRCVRGWGSAFGRRGAAPSPKFGGDQDALLQAPGEGVISCRFRLVQQSPLVGAVSVGGWAFLQFPEDPEEISRNYSALCSACS